ncbi:hypothetical protein BC830DRAFT_1122305 [Chytriomyces sp. MP71]|nr:hypothetical protein BC830DRAFT_1122305 [Chytriomyces sp. MP71]
MTTANLRTPLLSGGAIGAFPSNAFSSAEIVSPETLGFLPSAVASVSVDARALLLATAAVRAWQRRTIALLLASVPVPVVALLILRLRWADIPNNLPVSLLFVFPVSKNSARALLLMAPWIALAFATLAIRFFAGPGKPTHSISAFTSSSISTTPPPRLPISPSTVAALRATAKHASHPTSPSAPPPPIAQSTVESIVFWAEHPASLRLRNHMAGLAFSVASFTTLLLFFILLLGALSWPPTTPATPLSIPVNVLLLLLPPAIYRSLLVLTERALKRTPLENGGTVAMAFGTEVEAEVGGSGSEGLVAGVDVRAVVLGELDASNGGWYCVEAVKQVAGEAAGIAVGEWLLFFMLV